MIIDVNQILYVQYREYDKEYEVVFKNHEGIITISRGMYKELAKQIKKIKDVSCSLLCL